MSFKKIVCGTDFSAGATHALDMAIKLAVRHGAELVVAHAWELPMFAGDMGFSADLVDATLHADEELLAKAVRHATERGVRKVVAHHLHGVAWQAIVELAAVDPTVDLIVVGTHGRTGLRRVLLGSVAAKIVRLSPVSVLAVHPDDRLAPIHRVLWPTDLSDSAEHAGELAVQLVDGDDGRLERVHVVDKPRGLEAVGDALAIIEDLERRSTALLEQSRTHFDRPVQVVRRAIVGHPSEQLLMLLEANQYDLVAVGSHGRTGFERLRLGSIAELVVRHAHCPVLVGRLRRLEN